MFPSLLVWGLLGLRLRPQLLSRAPSARVGCHGGLQVWTGVAASKVQTGAQTGGNEELAESCGLLMYFHWAFTAYELTTVTPLTPRSISIVGSNFEGCIHLYVEQIDGKLDRQIDR